MAQENTVRPTRSDTMREKGIVMIDENGLSYVLCNSNSKRYYFDNITIANPFRGIGSSFQIQVKVREESEPRSFIRYVDKTTKEGSEGHFFCAGTIVSFMAFNHDEVDLEHVSFVFYGDDRRQDDECLQVKNIGMLWQPFEFDAEQMPGFVEITNDALSNLLESRAKIGNCSGLIKDVKLTEAEWDAFEQVVTPNSFMKVKFLRGEDNEQDIYFRPFVNFIPFEANVALSVWFIDRGPPEHDCVVHSIASKRPRDA